MPDDLKIADLVEDPGASEWLDYPDIPGFRVLLAAPDNPAQVRLATQVARIPDGAEQDAEFHYRKVRQYVAGWEGLQVKDLCRFFPGKELKTTVGEAEMTPAEPEAKLPYNPENLDFLLSKSQPFYRWVNAQVNAREVQEAADLKNSLAMPIITPTRTPAPARAARKNKNFTA